MGDFPPLVEKLVKILFYGGSTGFTMMSWEDIDLFVKGALFLYQAINAFLPLAAEAIYSWTGCSGIYTPAEATRGQLYDTWTGCPDRDKYWAGIWMLKGAEWGSIIIGGFIVKKVKSV